jgi:hypothetical protein
MQDFAFGEILLIQEGVTAPTTAAAAWHKPDTSFVFIHMLRAKFVGGLSRLLPLDC